MICPCGDLAPSFVALPQGGLIIANIKLAPPTAYQTTTRDTKYLTKLEYHEWSVASQRHYALGHRRTLDPYRLGLYRSGIILNNPKPEVYHNS